MSRLFIIALALSASVVLGAQTATPPPTAPAPTPAPRVQQPPTPAPQMQQPTQPDAQKAATVTYSGCLKPGASGTSFILADAVAVQAPSAGAAKPEPQARGTTGATKSYNLMPGKTGEDLSKHMNQRIEVTGTVGAASGGASASSTPPSATGASASATPPAGGTAQPTETFNMQSFKMVSGTCP